MRCSSLAILATFATGFVAADDGLKIEVTKAVACDRKTKNGDDIAVNYNGTLTNGQSFDSSNESSSPRSGNLCTDANKLTMAAQLGRSALLLEITT